MISDDPIVYNQKFIFSTRALRMTIPSSRLSMSRPPCVRYSSMSKKRFLQIQVCGINLLVDGFDEGLDVAFLPEDERGEGDGGGVDGDAGGVVAAVLEAAESVEEDLEDVAPLPPHIAVQVREYPAHFFPPPSSAASAPPASPLERERERERSESKIRSKLKGGGDSAALIPVAGVVFFR